MFGLRQGDMVVGVILGGVILGKRFYARPVARDSASGNTSRFLVLRGKIVPRGYGGCDLLVSIYPARVFRSLWRLWSGFGLVFGLAGYLASGDARKLLFGIAVFAGLGLFAEAVRRSFQRIFGETGRRLFPRIKPSERAVATAWVEAVTAELRASRVAQGN
jgi:hypothetical protein